MTWIAVALAVAGACCYALGARWQNTAVRERSSATGSTVSIAALCRLARNPGWLLGLALLGGGTALHVTAVAFAPLTVVQPVGVLALTLTAVLHARDRRLRLNPASLLAVVACTGGVALFVVLATGAAHPAPVTGAEQLRVLGLLAVAAVVLAVLIAIGRGRCLLFTVGAGVAFGFVATLTRVVTQRFHGGGLADVSPLAVLGIALAGVAGGWCVQQAHANGPPDLVVAGLTVLDPLVAVGIGIAVLGEAPHLAPLTGAALGAAALVATTGVFVLARHHPDASGPDDPRPAVRNTATRDLTTRDLTTHEYGPHVRVSRPVRRAPISRYDVRSVS